MPMRIQSILFPQKDICKEAELYYRHPFKQFGNKFLLPPNQTISFDTYFNSFPIAQWKQYTSIDNLSLFLRIQGKCTIELFEATLVNGNVQKRILLSKEKNAQDDSITLLFPDIADLRGACYFTISSQEEPCLITDGYYSTEIGSNLISTIKIGIGICTYKRESFVLKNLKAIQNAILDNPQSELFDKLEIIVSDNGQTLQNYDYSHPKVKIVPNINAGGSGGFAKCMLEAISRSSDFHFTNLILMDDDIILEPDVLARTYSFLRCLKNENRTKVLGGAMLKSESMSEQAVNGCIWDIDKGVRFCKSNYDLSQTSDVLKNLNEDGANFAPWFYCCFPMQHIRNNNLPLPFFFQYDDTEFALREPSSIILLNGISVWHTFLNKNNMCKRYCQSKNSRIVKLLYGETQTILQSKKELCLMFINLVGTYRYLDWIALSQAEIDLWHGQNNLRDKKNLLLCQKMIKKSNLQCKTDEIPPSASKYIVGQKDNGEWSIIKKITFAFSSLNTFFPKTRKNIIVDKPETLNPLKVRFVKKIYLKQDDSSYIIFQSNIKLFFTSFLQIAKILLYPRPNQEKLQSNLIEGASAMRKMSFWLSYLTK